MQEKDNSALRKAENIADKSNENTSRDSSEVFLPTKKQERKARTLKSGAKMSRARKKQAKARLKEQNRLRKEKAKIVLSRERSQKRDEIELKKHQLKKQKQEQKHQRKMLPFRKNEKIPPT